MSHNYCRGEISLVVDRVQHVQDTSALHPVCGSVASTCTAASLAVGNARMWSNLCPNPHSCSPGETEESQLVPRQLSR